MSLQEYETQRTLARVWEAKGCGKWYEYYDVGAHIDLLTYELLSAQGHFEVNSKPEQDGECTHCSGEGCKACSTEFLSNEDKVACAG